jgi:hypothetical protein
VKLQELSKRVQLQASQSAVLALIEAESKALTYIAKVHADCARYPTSILYHVSDCLFEQAATLQIIDRLMSRIDSGGDYDKQLLKALRKQLESLGEDLLSYRHRGSNSSPTARAIAAATIEASSSCYGRFETMIARIVEDRKKASL